MTTPYPHLFSPGEIGGVSPKNRIVQTPMGTGLIDLGRVTEREVAFQEERARAGVGLLITGGAVVHPTSRFPARIIIDAWDENGIEALSLRSDGYGGSVEARLRLLVEIVEEIRTRCGHDFPIGARLSAEDYVPGGLTLDDTREIAVTLQDAAPVDYLSVTTGMRGYYVKDS